MAHRLTELIVEKLKLVNDNLDYIEADRENYTDADLERMAEQVVEEYLQPEAIEPKATESDQPDIFEAVDAPAQPPTPAPEGMFPE